MSSLLLPVCYPRIVFNDTKVRGAVPAHCTYSSHYFQISEVRKNGHARGKFLITNSTYLPLFEVDLGDMEPQLSNLPHSKNTSYSIVPHFACVSQS